MKAIPPHTPKLKPLTSVSLLCRRAIRAAFKNRQRGAVLTTHYMEEAEAVCDRVAIVVSGQLRLVLTAVRHSVTGQISRVGYRFFALKRYF